MRISTRRRSAPTSRSPIGAMASGREPSADGATSSDPSWRCVADPIGRRPLAGAGRNGMGRRAERPRSRPRPNAGANMSRRCEPKSRPTPPRPRVRAPASSGAQRRTAKDGPSPSNAVPATTALRWGCPAASRPSAGTGRPHSGRRPCETAKVVTASARHMTAKPDRAARASEAARETNGRRDISPATGRASASGRAPREAARETMLGARSAVRVRTSSRVEAPQDSATALPGAAPPDAPISEAASIVARRASPRDLAPLPASVRRWGGARGARRENRELLVAVGRACCRPCPSPPSPRMMSDRAKASSRA